MCSQKHAHPAYKKDSYKYKKEDYDSDESDEPYFKKGEGKVCAGNPPTDPRAIRSLSAGPTARSLMVSTAWDSRIIAVVSSTECAVLHRVSRTHSMGWL